MSRPPRNDDKIYIKLHVNQGYRYARAQVPYETDSGEKRYRSVHFGTVSDNLEFIPNHKFLSASEQERSSFVFPPEWDITAAFKQVHPTPGRPLSSEDEKNRLYGHIWLLEQIAEVSGIRKDLLTVFDGNKAVVNDILTLSIFPYVTGFTYNRVERWQRIVKSPSDRPLSPSVITHLTQNITEQHRMELLRLRMDRLAEGEVCAVDSTSRSAYGNALADIRWGKNKEGLKLPQTNEVVVYSLSTHLPVYYRTFPGNMLDSRSLRTIFKDLDDAGFPDIILVTDRGYEKIETLETYILKGKAMIMCTKVQQALVKDVIKSFAPFTDNPKEMSYDRKSGIYFFQQKVEYAVRSTRAGSIKHAKNLCVNIYFDPMRRTLELKKLADDLYDMQEQLDELIGQDSPYNAAEIKKTFKYFQVAYDSQVNSITGYTRNDDKINKAKEFSGFFSITSHKLTMSAMEVLATYNLRDEQEKYFQQMKNQMASDRRRTWSEEGKTGRLFILFVSLILASQVRSTWKSALADLFSTSLEVLDEMKSIRCIEHPGTAKHITAFVGRQRDICKAFGFDIPQGCDVGYEIRKVEPKNRRGRPRKQQTENK
jgi:transposase